jgi:alpha-D-xyloside xylohydrolase
MTRAAWLVGFLCVLSGCGGDDEGGGAVPPSATIGGGDYTVRFDGKAGTLELRRTDTVLATFAPDAFVLGTVDEVMDSENYDPAPLLNGEPTAHEPAGLAWHPGKSARLKDSASDHITLTVRHEGGLESTVNVELAADGRFGASFVPSDATNVAYLELAPKADPDDAIYGLGEQWDSVDNRGTLRALQLELQATLENSYNENHVPVPFVTGSRGWGWFVQNPYPGAYDVEKTEPGRIAATFGTGLASKDGLAFHLFAAAHPLDVTKLYYDATSYPRLPARWALGPLIWRDENKDQAQFENDVQTIRDLDLATSAIWIDRPYATGVNTFDFNATQFPDPAHMIGLAHDLGLRMALWHTPYLDEKDASTQALRDEATQKGYYPPEHGLKLNGWGVLLDLTNPDAKKWWQSNIQKYVDMGIEGFKLDYGEDVVPGAFGARNVWKFSDGSDERTMHAFFQDAYHSTYSELLPEEGSFLLCRSACYGDQKFVDVIWPGDKDADLSKIFEQRPDGKKAVGGLPATLIAGLSLGPSGFPFFGSDTGGYLHSPPDKETFTRWFEVTSVSTVMQIGTSSNDVAWEFTPENGFDTEMLDWYRRYVRLHLRLNPYLWTYAKRLKDDGRPIQRALGLAYPELGEHPSDEFLLGDSLLAAPVVERGKTSREVILPPGKWTNFWTGEVLDGGSSVTVNAPLDTLPLYVPAGGIVPLLRPTIDTLSPVADPAQVDSYATTPGVLWARIAPGEKSSFVLFDGSEIGQEDAGATLLLTSKDGQEFSNGVLFEILGFGAAPTAVDDGGTQLASVVDAAALDAATSGWLYTSENGGSLWVKVGAGAHGVTVTR